MTEPSSVQRVGTADADERRSALLALVDAPDTDGHPAPGIGAIAPAPPAPHSTRPPADEAAVAEAIARALGDEDWRVRKEAVGLVRQVAPAQIVPALVAGIIQSENVGLRNAAIEAAGILGDAIVPALEVALSTGEGPSRRFIVSALGMTAALGASDALVTACVDPDENLVVAAVDALARIGGPKAEHAIRLRLADPDSFRRMAALDALDRLEVSVPFEELAPVLTDPVVRRAALGVLGRSRSDEAVPILFEALGERSASVQGTAVVSLEHLSEASDEAATRIATDARTLPASTLASVRRLLGHGEPRTRRAAAYLLLLARDAESLGDVLGLAAELSLSSASLAALSTWGASAIAPLLDLVEVSIGTVAALALEIAADLATQGADAETLARVRLAVRKALAGRDEPVREAAVRSLSACATFDDLALLVELATSARLEDSLRAGAALERLANENPAAVEAALVAVDAASGGGSLCPVLARFGTPAAIERIVTCLSADDPRTRRAAVIALGEIRGAQSVESLALALADEDIDVRATAAMMLGRLRDADGRSVGAERLQHAIDHESPVVQTAAVRALVDLGESRARDRIATLVQSKHPDVAATAIAALRALGYDAVTDLAIEAARSGADEVVIAALHVLGDRPVPDGAVDFVEGALAHPAWEARLAAVEVARMLPKGREWLLARRAVEQEPLVMRALEAALEEKP